jgi:GT2 family glycosyltransferase
MLPPAEHFLNLDEAAATRPAWARFDAAWYLARHAEAKDHCRSAADALPYYLEIGVQLGHSPSPLFDESWYLAQNPDVHELVRGGKYRSGFDHFCQHGHRVLSPHWLFDDALYARLHDDMSLENLDLHSFAGRYDHYLRSGQFERRTAHYIFDAAHYRLRAIEAGVDPAEIDQTGAFEHFLYSLRPGAPERRPSLYFEPAWYLEHAQGAAADIAEHGYGSALEHYLRKPSPELFDPLPQFSEAWYRAANADVAHAIETGEYRNGYQHFVRFGAYELRRPRPDIDLVYYRDANPRVAGDLRRGLARDAFAHLRLIGLPESLPCAPPDALPLITEPVARRLFERRARDSLAYFARHRLDFTTAAPALAVVMVLFNRFELTMQALASLRDNFPGGIELILVDNASTDETARIGQYVSGATVLRLPENIGYVRAANRALPLVTAPALLYLNNDVALGHGAIAAALARLGGAEDIGAVCGKIIRSHGALQEAGSIVWRDGSTSGYLRDAPALAPAANFVRDVDYGSAVFLLCRTALVQKLGGFDDDFAPSYYEDADLCLRARGAGYRIVYDPAITIHHLEFGSAQNSETALALMRRGQKIFARKHKAYLQTRPPKAPGNAIFARHAGESRRRVLFIEDTIPLRRLGSGFVRANDIVRAIGAAGYEVGIFPINGALESSPTMLGDFPEDAEIFYDSSIQQLESFLRERAGYYHLAWVSRTHNLARIRPILNAAGAALPIVLDTEAVATIRDAAQAAIADRKDKTFNFDAALRAEFAGAEACRHIIAVSRFEADLLTALGLRAVSLLGTRREPAPTAANFAARAGLLFVGAIHRPDSPNLDALAWYKDKILPALAEEMAEPPILNVAGYLGPDIDLSAFETPGIKLHGAADDLTPLYEACRVFIAPTRFAAGTPYKIYEAAAHGLPCVATDLLARQLRWTPGTDLLTAPVTDARRFAAQIAILYRTETIWTKLRHNAAARLAAENDAAGFDKAVKTVLETALPASASPMPRHRRAARHPVPVGERLGDM